MKKRNKTATEGALIVLLGISLGLLIAFVFHEYGIRESRIASARMDLTPKKKTTTGKVDDYWDGKRYVPGSKA